MVDEQVSPLKLDDDDRSRIRCRCLRVSIKPSLILGTLSCCCSSLAAADPTPLGIKSPSSKAC